MAQATVFGLLHAAARGRAGIIQAPQVQEAMEDVAEQFSLPGDAKPPRLRHGFGNADEELSMQGGGGGGRRFVVGRGRCGSV